MKKYVALLLTLAMLACCLIACDKGEGGTAQTVSIEVYDAENNIFLRNKEMTLTEGMTVRSAIETLCTDRGYTVEFDSTGFKSFASDGEGEDKITLQAFNETNADGTFNSHFLGWFLNGEDKTMNNPADVTLKAGDALVIKFKVEANITPDQK